MRSVTFMVHLTTAPVDDHISKIKPVPVEGALLRMHYLLVGNQASVSPPLTTTRRQDCPSKL